MHDLQVESIADKVLIESLYYEYIQNFHKINECTWYVRVEVVESFLYMGHIVFCTILLLKYNAKSYQRGNESALFKQGEDKKNMFRFNSWTSSNLC